MLIDKSKNDAQIRLLLPKKWVHELDILAASRSIKRLAVIRLYLRIMMDKELGDLTDLYKKREQFEITKKKLKQEIYIDRDWDF